VKWEERIIEISVSAGTLAKMAEVGVTAWKMKWSEKKMV
jgi:hypothetical protein